MRFAAYAGTSVALAAGTVIRAFYERSNFYSASVAIAQSNASLMVLKALSPKVSPAHKSQILTNVALLGVSMFMVALQRLCYGPLRPIEVEQLYEKAWFAITETCLAMTIFREEVGGWFMIMFVSLLIGKVWGWIGEGRVEILEQQPPANPRLFHTQLSISLSISSLFDVFMLRYAVNTVLRHARPNMMVMFAFEFAVLAINSLSTAARYAIFVFEASVIRKQMDERRSQLRRDREQARLEANIPELLSGRDAETGIDANSEEDIEAMDFDAPGWEEKGRWMFYLDLATDFLKLVLYLTFFCVLCMFYGMPIHIIRDVALTIRSFHKRIRDFMRYRKATRDMNSRYPDATADEVAREDVCIICRENMRPWSAQQGDQPAREQANPQNANRVDERSRPKKLPCGHILHFGCLRSWLERQQNCPTCRRPVLIPDTTTQAQGAPLQHQQARQAPIPQNPTPQRDQAGQVGQAVPNPAPPPNVYQFGPIRVVFGTRQLPQRPQQNNITPSTQQVGLPSTGSSQSAEESFSRPTTHTYLDATSTTSQLQQVEQNLLSQINGLRLQHDQLYLVRALQGELMRLRLLQTNSSPYVPGLEPNINQSGVALPIIPQAGLHHFAQSSVGEGQMPAGMTIPPGWTLVPLRRLSNTAASNSEESRPSTSRSTRMDRHTPTTTSHDIPETTIPRDETPVTTSTNLVSSAQSQNVESLTKPPGEGPVAESSVANESLNDEMVASSRRRAEPVEESSSHPSSGIPNWGSGPAMLRPRSTSDFEEGSDSMLVESQSAAENSEQKTRDKGKGKAMTVEDSVDDVD